MAVAFDAVGPSSSGQTTTPGTSITWSHTCSGSLRAVVVGVAVDNTTWAAAPASATFGGASMTVLGHIESNNQTTGYVALLGLVNPPTGASTVTVTTAASGEKEGGSVSFNGVDQTTPFGTAVTAFGSSATPSASVSSAAGNMVVDAVCNGSNITSSTQTSRWIANNTPAAAAGSGAQATAAGAASVTMSWNVTSDWWGLVAVDVKASGGAAPAIPSFLIMQTRRP